MFNSVAFLRWLGQRQEQEWVAKRGKYLTIWWFQLAVATFLRMRLNTESNSDFLKWIEFVRLNRGARISIHVWVCYFYLATNLAKTLWISMYDNQNLKSNVCKAYGLLLYDVLCPHVTVSNLPPKLHGYQVLHRMPDSLWCAVGGIFDGSRRRELGCFVSHHRGSLVLWFANLLIFRGSDCAVWFRYLIGDIRRRSFAAWW